MINQYNLEVNVKELISVFQNKQLVSALVGNPPDIELDQTLRVLELCQDAIQDGTYEDGYDKGYEQAKDEYSESSYAEGWDDCKNEVTSILNGYNINADCLQEIEDL